MRACVMLEPQDGLSYEQILHVARLARQIGLEGTFRSDHYQGFGGRTDGPATDAWATLAGLVREVADGVVGTLVSPLTFRHAGNLGKVVATVASMSTGPKVELGVGTGWNPSEHTAYDFDFGSFDHRFRRLPRYLEVVKGILAGAAVDGTASHPAAPDVRIIVGGGGPRRTPRLAARYADELNLVMMPPDAVADRVKTCRDFVKAEGRPPDAVRFSWMGPFIVGRTEAEVEERAARLGAPRGAPADAVLSRMKGAGAVGTVSDVSAFLERLGEAGVTRVMLQHLLVDDDEHLTLGAEAAVAAGVA